MNYILAYARSLDAMVAALNEKPENALTYADDALHDALIEIGDILGGLSVHGFERDLIASIDATADPFDKVWMANDWCLIAQAIMTGAEAVTLKVAA